MEDLVPGTIIDAQDYLGGWHLSIVCEIKPNDDNEYLRVNFVEYPRGNRDEWLKKSELERVAGPFAHSESILEKDFENITKGLNGLREYSMKFA